MLVPIVWLKDYTKVPEDIREYFDRMTLTGTKSESIEYSFNDLENVVSARVTETAPHPDLDHLLVVKVFDGRSEKTVVCGAKNVNAGDIAAFAGENALIYGGIRITKTAFETIESEGMLCSCEELGFSSSVIPKNAQEGIYIMPADTPVGEDITDLLGLKEAVIDFELTNNRQDCNSILGIAAETAASYGKRFEYPEYEFDPGSDRISDFLEVEVQDYSLCRRYTAKMVKVKKIEPSPLWMQARLMAAGIRPINNIVDVSNFVMTETGQPLHTFDYDRIGGHKIIVKTAHAGEKFTTLDGTERELTEAELMIDDINGHIGIAGIMGGENSEITEDTEYVVIESANFSKNSIRQSSKLSGLRTESSSHFEKGVSIHLTRYAADRAASLLEEIGAGECIEGIIDKYETLDGTVTVETDADWLNKLIGISLTGEEAAGYLDLLGFKTSVSGSILTAEVPKFRQDIKLKEDIAEEVARLYGYDNIPMTMLESLNFTDVPNTKYACRQFLKELMTAAGGYEILTYSFISPQKHKDMLFDQTDPRAEYSEVINPLGEDYSVMRTTLMTGLLDSLALNSSRKNPPELMFELSNIYYSLRGENELPVQKEKLVFGKYDADFYELKSVASFILDTLRIKDVKYVRSNENMLHPGRSADIYADGNKIGFVGQIHPAAAKKFGVEENTSAAELDAEFLAEQLSVLEFRAEPIAKYPAITRDLSLVADDSVMADEIKDTIIMNAGEYLTGCEVFDVYRSDSLGAGKKSISFSLTFRSENSTLKDDFVDVLISDILYSLREQNITLRG